MSRSGTRSARQQRRLAVKDYSLPPLRSALRMIAGSCGFPLPFEVTVDVFVALARIRLSTLVSLDDPLRCFRVDAVVQLPLDARFPHRTPSGTGRSVRPPLARMADWMFRRKVYLVIGFWLLGVIPCLKRGVNRRRFVVGF